MNEAELLFTQALGLSRTDLYLNKGLKLDKDKALFVSQALKRRFCFEPIQYILAKTEFMGLEFIVNKDVFIPRPETEILVEAVLKLASGFRPQASSLNIMDIGTGSGNIAVSLAVLLNDSSIIAIDISQEAIAVARQNAFLNEAAQKVNFITQDFFNLQPAACSLQPFSFDIIVSNPPYIPSAQIDKLQPEISYEPRIALDGGDDGLVFYRRIIRLARMSLKEGGFLAMEIGFAQRKAVEDILKRSNNFKIEEILKDYNNIERVVIARKEVKDG